MAVPKVGISAAVGGADGVSSTDVTGGSDLATILSLTLSANTSDFTPQSQFRSGGRVKNGRSLRLEP